MLVWSSLVSRGAGAVKSDKTGFNLVVCLEVVLMGHVKVIFRSASVLSKSMSLTLGGSHIWVTLNVEPERSPEPVAGARTLGHWLSFTTRGSVPSVKGHFFSEEEVGERAVAAAPTLTRPWDLLNCGNEEQFFILFLTWALLYNASDTLLLSFYERLFPLS